MSDFINIPLGQNVPSQIPLDVKQYISNETELKDLGIGNYKAFAYIKGLIIYCILEKTRYEWTEVTSENNGKGLLPVNFRYPTIHNAFGINYSNTLYNFFKIVYNDKIIDGSETKLTAGSNITISGLGTQLSPYIISGQASSSQLFLENGNNTTIIGNGSSLTPYKVNVTFPSAPNGSETKVQSGTNINVSGNGTIASPYTISSTVNYSPTILNSGDNTVVTGIGSSGDPYKVNVTFPTPPTPPDGSETKINAGTNITVSGNGTIASPYNISSVSVESLQKTITSNYTLTSADNNSVIFINNGTFSINITVPTSLVSKFNCGFVQQGTGLVQFVASGVTINTPTGLKIKGQNYNTYIEKVGTTEIFHLLGNIIT